MVAIDAYFHIPIFKSHQKVPAPGIDIFNSGPCLFGLSSTPRNFSKFFITVIAEIRKLGIAILHYLNDILILTELKKV